MKLSIPLFALLLLLSCNADRTQDREEQFPKVLKTATGKEFPIAEPSEKNLEKYRKAKGDYEANPNNADNIIWYGRRAGYLPDYEKAIAIFSEGIEKFPKDARIYRHRGHRHISVRNFEAAITDLNRAAELIEGKENEIEPDGMPNAQNIPISTLHGNIWYHLGLAYFLKGDYENAFNAYTNCRNTGSNDDNIVSSTHWLFSIACRMKNDSLAEQMLEPIHSEMEIIENTSYYDLCKFYKGLIPIDSLLTEEGTPSGDAVKYGLANWYRCNGDLKNAEAMDTDILNGKAWNSFGFIASEADRKRDGGE